MPIDIKRALTDSGAIGPMVPEIKSTLVEQAAQPNRYMRQIAIVNTELQGGPGKSIEIPKIGGLDANVMASEDATLAGQVLPVDSIKIELQRIEATVDLSRDAIMRSYVDIMDQATQALGKTLGTKEDRMIMAAILADSNVHTLRVNDRASDDDITATDTLDTDTIKAAIEVLEANDAPGPFWLVIHPHQKGALLKDEQFVNASKYGDSTPRATGEIGEFLGARVVSTSNIPHAANGNNVEVYSALMLSSRSMVEALGEDITVLDSDMLPAGKLATRMTATMSLGVGVLNPEYTAVLKSA